MIDILTQRMPILIRILKMFEAKIILDSLSLRGSRLITMELTYPRFIHAEFMTHRMFSRNAASSRAIPTRKMIKMVEKNPAMPVYWGKNKRGMVAGEEIDTKEAAESIWLGARDSAVLYAKMLYQEGLHKQIVNRLLEPWKNITVICTATEWGNFYGLRRHEDAQPEIHLLADLMYKAQEESEPQSLKSDEWHMPYISKEDWDTAISQSTHGQSVAEAFYVVRNVSVARCARVSYLTHAGKRDLDKDLELFKRLTTGSDHGHWSPFEHVAMPLDNPNERSGNFVGWKQYRKMFEGECQ